MASEKITAIIDEIKTLTILEVADLVKALEEEFGVSAAAPVAAVGAVAAAPAEEEKTEFDVVLKEVGPNKVQVIKTVKEVEIVRGSAPNLVIFTDGTQTVVDNCFVIGAAQSAVKLPEASE